MDLKGIPGKLTTRFKADPEPYLLDLSVVLMCLVAFIKAVSTVWDLSWPCDVDLYRDIGFAQSLRNGYLLSDPLYLGEKLWYNPLVPGLIALGSALSGAPVHVVATKLGPFINLLSPIGFYVMAACLFGRRTAVASTVAYLFLNLGSLPSWASATYSPWLFPSNFVQGLFYFGVAAYWRALKKDSTRWTVAAGALLGLTFLGHTAPALILGAIMALVTLQVVLKTWHEGPLCAERHRALLRLGAALVAALLVSLPYAWSILFHYGLVVINEEPSSWLWGKIAVFGADEFVAQNLSLLTVLPTLGLLGVIMSKDRPLERRLVLYWFALALVLFLYTYVWQLLKVVGVQVPRIVPGHHFLIYVKAIEVLLFGHGLVLLIRYVVQLARYLLPAVDRNLTANHGREAWVRAALLGLAVLAALAAAYPLYGHREDYQIELYKAKRLAPGPGAMLTYNWIQEHTVPTDVFLASDHHTLHLLSSAGRKVVSTIAYFSNPFVDWKTRHKDRHELFASVENGDVKKFQRLVAKYAVGYVLVDPSQAVNPALRPLLKQSFAGGGVIIYKVLPKTSR